MKIVVGGGKKSAKWFARLSTEENDIVLIDKNQDLLIVY